MSGRGCGCAVESLERHDRQTPAGAGSSSANSSSSSKSSKSSKSSNSSRSKEASKLVLEALVLLDVHLDGRRGRGGLNGRDLHGLLRLSLLLLPLLPAVEPLGGGRERDECACDEDLLERGPSVARDRVVRSPAWVAIQPARGAARGVINTTRRFGDMVSPTGPRGVVGRASLAKSTVGASSGHVKILERLTQDPHN